MSTYYSAFDDWLTSKGYGNVVDAQGELRDNTVTQNFFSVQYTAWLSEVVKSTAVQDYLLQNHYIRNGDVVTVEMNQNSSTGVPYIKINGVASNVLDNFFSDREDVVLNTGKVTQVRYYSDIFSLGGNNAPELGDTTDPNAVKEANDAAAQDIAPLSGSFAVSDKDIGDTLTASVVGNPVVKLDGQDFSGCPTALTAASAFTLSNATQTSNGGAGTAIGWTYDPGAANLDFLREGQSLTITYQVKVSDGHADSATQDVTITITGTNDAVVLNATANPTAIAELSDAAAQDIAPLAGSFAVSDKDVGDTLTASVVGSPTVQLNGHDFSGFPAALSADGAFTLSNATQTSNGGAGTAIGWTYDPGAANLDFLKEGDTLTITYQVKVNDGHADSATQDVTITITGTNDAVVLNATANPTAIAELSDASAQDIAPLAGSFTVSDKDVGDTLTASVVGNPVVKLDGQDFSGFPAALTAASTFTLSNATQTSNGSTGSAIGWTYDPGAANLDFLREGQSLTITYQVKVSDGHADSTQDITIAITGTNDAPVLESTTAPAAVNEEANAAAQDLEEISGSFALMDKDVGDTLALKVGGPVVELQGEPFALPAGAATLTAAGAFSAALSGTLSTGDSQSVNYTYNPGAANLDFLREGQSLTITYQVTVNDGSVDSAAQDVTFTITGTNDAVVLSDTTDPTPVTEAANAAAQDIALISGSFAVSDKDVGDTLTASVVGSPTVQLNGHDFSGFPAALSADGAFTLSNTSQTSNGGAGSAIGWTYDPGAANLDFLKEGDSLTVTYQVKVSDGHADSTQDVTFTIIGTNDAPTVTAGQQSVQLVEAGFNGAGTATASIALSLADPDSGDTAAYDDGAMAAAGWTKAGDGLTFTKIGTYGTATLTVANGSVSYALDNADSDTNALAAGASATDHFAVYVKDGSNATASAAVDFHITGANDAPTDIVFTAQAPTSGSGVPTTVAQLSAVDPDANASVSFSLLNQATLADGDDRVFSVSGTQLLVTSGSGLDNKIDNYAVTVRATDELGATRDETIYVTFGTNTNGGDNISGATGDDIIYALGSGTGTGQWDVVLAGSGNDQVYGQDGRDELNGGTGADTLTGGNGNDIFVIGDGDSGITLATADRITDFVSGTDQLKLGIAGSTSGPGANYAEGSSAVADFNAALAAANAQLAGLKNSGSPHESFAFQFDATNGYLFDDTNGDGMADQAIVLVGVTSAGISHTDIVA